MPGAPPPDSNTSDERPPINAEWLERMRAEKPEFLARLFEVFLAEEPKRIARLGVAVAAGDLKMVLHLAHALKGAAATLGMERLRDASRGLEAAAKAEDMAALPVLLGRLQEETDTVYAVLAACIQT